MISIEEAYQHLKSQVQPLGSTIAPLVSSVGRVLVNDIAADVDSPPHRKSVMDGYAVRSADINHGQQRLKVIETVVAGQWPQQKIASGEAVRIMTGAPLPEGADAVVMIELTRPFSEQSLEWVEIQTDAIPAGKHVMGQADHFATGDVVFPAKHRVRSNDIGLMAEVGSFEVAVGGLPTVALLPTGDELVPCDQQPARGQLRNSNGPLLVALAQEAGLEVTDLGIGRDQPDSLEKLILQGLNHDMLLLTGGVSAGLLDLVPGILKKNGVQEVFHHVNMKPGKPIWFGVLNQDERCCYVFGLPGNPVSSMVGFHLLVKPVINRLAGADFAQPTQLQAILTVDHETRGDRPTFWPGRWVVDGSVERKVEPLLWKGSSDLSSLGKADGLICFAAGSKIHPAGLVIAFTPFEK